MDTTPISLLKDLRQHNKQEDWNEFVQLFTPLLCRWARALRVQSHDADDLIQEVFTKVVRELFRLDYDPAGSFRAWLRTLLLNIWRNRRDKRSPDQLPAGAEAELPAREERQDHCFLVARALELAERRFPPLTMRIFRAYVIDGRNAGEVAAELHVSANQVYLAKGRVLAWLRQRMEGLLD